MHVVQMTSAHPADDIRIFRKQCLSLAAAGERVTLIAPDDGATPISGSVALLLFPRENLRWRRFIAATARVFARAVRQKADVYHLHDPELIPVGLALKLLGKRVVYDAHEDLAAQVRDKAWIPKAIRPVAVMFARLLIAAAGACFDGIVAATPKIGTLTSEAKTVVVQNFPTFDDPLSQAQLQPYCKRPRHVVYVGGINEIRGAREMIEAAKRLAEHHGAKLDLIGAISDSRLANELQQQAGDAVVFWGPQSRQRTADILTNGRIGLVLYHPLANHIESQPNKLFEYMAAGIPVVASKFPHWQAIVETNRCGLCVNPLDVDEIVAACAWLLDHPDEAEAMGQNGRAAVRSLYNWEAEFGRLQGLYRRLVRR